MIIINIKICSKCKTEKPIDHFAKSNTSKDGFQHCCKQCNKLYRDTHKKELSEYFKIHYIENREDKLEYQIGYYTEHSEKVKNNSREWYKNNKEKALKRGKKYTNDNIINSRQYKSKYKKTDNGKLNNNIFSQKRRSRKKNLINDLTKHQWLDTLMFFNYQCVYCGLKEEEHKNKYNQVLHQEHLIPISKDGKYTKNNIIPSCMPCNSSKGDKDFLEWYVNSIVYDKEKEQKIIDFIYINSIIENIVLQG